MIKDRISEFEAAAHDTLRRYPPIENHPLFIYVSGSLELHRPYRVSVGVRSLNIQTRTPSAFSLETAAKKVQ